MVDTIEIVCRKKFLLILGTLFESLMSFMKKTFAHQL